MNNYYLETESRRYRPVQLSDAEFIVKLRTQPHAQRVLHSTSSDIDKQRDWIRQYLQRNNDYYWIIENLDGEPIGTTSLYNYNAEMNQIESGRWVQIPDSGTGSLSGHVLFKDFAYNVLRVNRVVCDTAIINKQVIKYHQFLGERIFDRKLDDVEINGKKIEVVWFEETAEMWLKNRKKLLKFCGKETDRKAFKMESDGSLSEIDLHFEKHI